MSRSIRQALAENSGLYYPTYFHLREVTSIPGHYGLKKSATQVSRKGKGSKTQHLHISDEFEEEKQAVLQRLSLEQDPDLLMALTASEAESSTNAPAVDPVDVPLPEGTGIECGCCFAEYAFEEMVQCPEAHLFCKDCAKRNAESALGMRKAVISCMDSSSESSHIHISAFDVVVRFLIAWTWIVFLHSVQAGVSAI